MDAKIKAGIKRKSINKKYSEINCKLRWNKLVQASLNYEVLELYREEG